MGGGVGNVRKSNQNQRERRGGTPVRERRVLAARTSTSPRTREEHEKASSASDVHASVDEAIVGALFKGGDSGVAKELLVRLHSARLVTKVGPHGPQVAPGSHRGGGGFQLMVQHANATAGCRGGRDQGALHLLVTCVGEGESGVWERG